MPKFILAYHGGGRPDTHEARQAAMAAWGAWMEKYKAEIVDPGAPVGQSQTVSSDGVADHGGANPLSGYTILNCADMQTAISIAQDCPIVDHNGGSVEVAPILEM